MPWVNDSTGVTENLTLFLLRNVNWTLRIACYNIYYNTKCKKLTEKKRNELRSVIEKNALAWSVAFVGVNEIDEINILNASILAMHRALDELTIDFEHIAVDGNRFKDYKNIESTCIIKGDSKFQNIAAASILAKTYRDDYMKKIHEEFPAYNWSKNKGYPTKEHRNAIEKLGPCKYHRLSFSLLPKQVKLDL